MMEWQRNISEGKLLGELLMMQYLPYVNTALLVALFTGCVYYQRKFVSALSRLDVIENDLARRSSS